MTGRVWQDVAGVADVPPGQVRGVHVAGRALALVNLDGKVHAVSAVCPHQGGSLDQGRIWDGKLQCPWHNFLFDVTTGANAFPANVYPKDMPGLRLQLAPLEVYSVRTEQGRILVQLELEEAG